MSGMEGLRSLRAALSAKRLPAAVLPSLQTASREALQPEKTARLLSAQAGERRLIVTGFPFGNPYFIRVPDAVFHKDDPFIVLSKIGGDTGNKNRITK